MKARFLPRLFAVALSLGLLGTLAMPDVAEAVSSQLKERISRAKDNVKESKKALKDNEKDLKEIEKILERWQAARQDRNDKKLSKADEDLLEWLREEIAENRADRQAARAELEAAGGSAEEAPTRARTGSGGKVRPGGGGSSGRSREPAAAADARADFEAADADMRQTREIAEQLRELQGRFENGRAGQPAFEQKEELLRELVRGARRDVRRSTRELAEDEETLDRLKARR